MRTEYILFASVPDYGTLSGGSSQERPAFVKHTKQNLNLLTLDAPLLHYFLYPSRYQILKILSNISFFSIPVIHTVFNSPDLGF